MAVIKHFGILALAAAALAVDIPTVPTWPSGRCTDKSLTIPSWVISDFKQSGDSVAFHIENRASSISTDVKCAAGAKCTATSSKGLQTTVKKESGSWSISVEDEWMCDDASDKITFNANGAGKIPVCNTSQCTAPIPHLIHGSLTFPVPLTPSQPSPPSGYDAPSCASVGDSLWTIRDVSYKKYDKGQCTWWYREDLVCIDPGDFISKGEYLNFTLTNNAISHDIKCGFTPDTLKQDYSIPSTLHCIGGKFNEITLDVAFSGTAPNFNLEIEQLWYCLENPATNAKPTALVANGSVSLPLKCSQTTGITGTDDDVVTTCVDPTPSHSVAGKQKAKKSLPEFSLVTAYPAEGGCTYNSIVNPTWYMSYMFFETYNTNTSLNRFTVILNGPSFSQEIFLSDGPREGDGENSYDCNYLYNGKPKDQHWECRFSFDIYEHLFNLRKVWECRDKDNAHPLFFGGSGIFDWDKEAATCNGVGRCSWWGPQAWDSPGLPFEIPRVDVSLENTIPLSNIKTVRVDGKWTKAS